jgi:hypothetical protein
MISIDLQELRITFPHSRRDPALDSSYLRPGRVLSEYSSLIIHPTTKGRKPRSVNALLCEVQPSVLSEYSSLIIHPTTKGRKPRSVNALLCEVQPT